jgi:hypothetical protein
MSIDVKIDKYKHVKKRNKKVYKSENTVELFPIFYQFTKNYLAY